MSFDENLIDSAINSLDIKTSNDTLVKMTEEANNSGIKLTSEEKPKASPLVLINSLDRELAVKEKLIPECYEKAIFDIEKIKKNISEQYTKSKGIYKVYRFKDYTDTCSAILTTLRTGQIPKRSYIIGAPNGFGKSSFVNECLITMRKQNWICAPYISLHELAEIRTEEEKRLMKPFSYTASQGIYEQDGKYYNTKEVNGYTYTDFRTPIEIVKKPTIIQSAYSWNEYINAKCLFVHFTDVISKDLESHVLYQLLSIRGAKGLPTIAMISTSLEPYLKDTSLREIVWDEILDYDVEGGSCDRIKHVSCYKAKKLDFSKDGEIDKDTGIVLK